MKYEVEDVKCEVKDMKFEVRDKKFEAICCVALCVQCEAVQDMSIFVLQIKDLHLI